MTSHAKGCECVKKKRSGENNSRYIKCKNRANLQRKRHLVSDAYLQYFFPPTPNEHFAHIYRPKIVVRGRVDKDLVAFL